MEQSASNIYSTDDNLEYNQPKITNLSLCKRLDCHLNEEILNLKTSEYPDATYQVN